MERANAREQAALCVFEYGFMGDEQPGEFWGRVIADRGLKPSDFMKRLTLGAIERAGELDAIIGAYAQGWAVQRIARLHMAVMRVVLYEMIYERAPGAIAINEALELCRKYAGEEGVGFVNGVLNGWVKDQPDLPSAYAPAPVPEEESDGGGGHE